jgi:DNA topoisomerase-1
MDSITREEALFLFQLPRKLGMTAAGEDIVANTGRFGPYVKYGPKYVSLKTDDPYTVTYERALEVIREKEIADANRLIRDFPEAGFQVLNGRYGPYVKDKTRNAKIPKDRDPKSLTLEECQALLAAAPARDAKAGAPAKTNGGAAAPAAPTRSNRARKKASSPAAAPGAAAPAAATASASPRGSPASAGTAAARKTPPARPAARLAAKGLKAAAKKRAPADLAAAPKAAKTKRRKT